MCSLLKEADNYLVTAPVNENLLQVARWSIWLQVGRDNKQPLGPVDKASLEKIKPELQKLKVL